MKRRQSDRQTLLQMHESYKKRFEDQKARFKSEYGLEAAVPGSVAYDGLDTGHQDLCRMFYSHAEVVTAVSLSALSFDLYADCVVKRGK